jgi:hypothetical protein
MHKKKSTSDINHEIRLIDKKIRQCQRKIEEDKKMKMEGTNANIQRIEEFKKIGTIKISNRLLNDSSNYTDTISNSRKAKTLII